MLKIIETGEPSDCECNEVAKRMIQYNELTNEYIIPADLNFENLPAKIVNDFLDTLNELALSKEALSTFLEMIKDGLVTITCSEDHS